MLLPTYPPPSKSSSSQGRGSMNLKNGTTKLVYKTCAYVCVMAGGPSEASIFSMVGALVISWALNACQSARMMVIEVDEALISIKYYNLSSNGLSCSVSKDGLIVLVYSSA